MPDGPDGDRGQTMPPHPWLRQQAAFPPRQVRDLTIWSDSGDLVYVLACDANASVGQLPHDFLQRPPEEAGFNAAKVVLMEVLATGALPIIVVNTLCGPLDSYGSRVLAGIRHALDEVGSDAVVTGSDETNMRTTQTGVGVTIVGRALKQDLRLGSSRSGDAVVCLGLPKDGVGVAYGENDPDVASLGDLVGLLQSDIRELLPVGSKGVAHELAQLANTAGLSAVMAAEVAFDFQASAGASTCLLASLAAESVDQLRTATPLPITLVAHLESRTPSSRV